MTQLWHVASSISGGAQILPFFICSLNVELGSGSSTNFFYLISLGTKMKILTVLFTCITCLEFPHSVGEMREELLLEGIAVWMAPWGLQCLALGG